MEPSIFVVLALVVGAGLAVLAMLMLRARSIKAARARFGPEYGRAVEEAGSRHKAAALLHQREKRVERFKLHAIGGDVREAFDARWKRAQTGFIESPLGAVTTADALLDDVLTARGYPEAKFEQRAADLSVHHPELVHDFRTAHGLAQRDEAEELNTEELRQAMLAYKSLYEEIVGPAAADAVPAQVLNVEPERTDERAAEVRDDGDLEYAERSFEAQRAAADAVTHAAEPETLREVERREAEVGDDQEVLAIVDGKKVKATIEDRRKSG